MGVTKHSIRIDSLSKWDLANYSSHLPWGKKKVQYNLLVLFMSNYFVRTRWAIPKISVKYDSRHPLTDALTFLLCVFFCYKKMSLLLVIKDHKPTLWSLTGPQQLLNLICSISIVFANYTQSTLDFADDKDSPWRLGKWLNLGLSDALTGSCACAFSRQPRQSAFYKAVSCAVSPTEIRKHQQRVSVHIDR